MGNWSKKQEIPLKIGFEGFPIVFEKTGKIHFGEVSVFLGLIPCWGVSIAPITARHRRVNGMPFPGTVGNIEDKLFIALVTLSETMRKNCYLLTLQDELALFAIQFEIKRHKTVVKVLIWE